MASIQMRSWRRRTDTRLADIFNLLELGCAVFHDELLIGHTGTLPESLIQTSEEAGSECRACRTQTRTFGNILAVLGSHKKRVSAEMVLPGGSQPRIDYLEWRKRRYPPFSAPIFNRFGGSIRVV